MPNNFITNATSKNLRHRIVELIGKSQELNFLVGFFYFSGIQELYQGIKENKAAVLKVLVGLNVDKKASFIWEVGKAEPKSDDEITLDYFASLRKSLNTPEFDTQEFYEQSMFFINLIREGRLVIRKTRRPNHSKLYIFLLEEGQTSRQRFITGSSNLTRAGLSTQDEFNVEIGDYGFDDALCYFNALWKESAEITEHEETKQKLLEVLEKGTLVNPHVTPFVAYCLALKTYLDSFSSGRIKDSIPELMEANGYIPYRYQLDAIQQALAILEKHHGVIIADVVGLGKTVIACAIANSLGKRGIIICPPALIDRYGASGWEKYKEDFKLWGWNVFSVGELNRALAFLTEKNDIEVVIIDEAHRFRNQDTQGYEHLKNICRNKQVILLTATPFNNRPADILSLLKLFILPKKSSISLDNNLAGKFAIFGATFDKLGYIKKNGNSPDPDKRAKATDYYFALFGERPIDIKKVDAHSKLLAAEMRDVLEPVTIRRNRLDLLNDPVYKQEIPEFSKVTAPQEWFFELSYSQSLFYDEILREYFGENSEISRFKGAIYRPFEYEKGIVGAKTYEKQEEKGGQQLTQQRNLFDFMRRMLVKRFESSFGAFAQSIDNFLRVLHAVQDFVQKTGKYILDRDLLEKLLERDEEEIETSLLEYEKELLNKRYPKNHKVYHPENFVDKEGFFRDIQSDIEMFGEIQSKLDNLNLIAEDPKVACLLENIQSELAKNNERKIIVFTEYVDTLKHIEPSLRKVFDKRLLVICGSIGASHIEQINSNFDASYKKQRNDFDVLLTTDKLSEGFNLNRAGLVINYDIPWNPVRVIQRVGRINRISKKVFEEIGIVNFFPTERGAQLVQSREIAANKMFLIHSALGEDACIFDADEEPTPARLYEKIKINPEALEDVSFFTKVRQEFARIKEQNPDIEEELATYPPRIKVAKCFSEDELLIIYKKDRVYVSSMTEEEDAHPQTITFADALAKIACDETEPKVALSDTFWTRYEQIKNFTVDAKRANIEQSLEQRALNNLNTLLQIREALTLTLLKEFLRTLREDIIDYGTLPDYTLRTIAGWDHKKIETTVREISNLRDELGADYLQKEKYRLAKLEKEIIIAIENRVLGK
ncbi:MAG: DEAD/DEAH box helicase family protein [Deltaproteobacteria bacterium]|nr:DEAD/DEAH box helicase family protein [Deltaproteobacteria bacterium]